MDVYMTLCASLYHENKLCMLTIKGSDSSSLVLEKYCNQDVAKQQNYEVSKFRASMNPPRWAADKPCLIKVSVQYDGNINID